MLLLLDHNTTPVDNEIGDVQKNNESCMLVTYMYLDNL